MNRDAATQEGERNERPEGPCATRDGTVLQAAILRPCARMTLNAPSGVPGTQSLALMRRHSQKAPMIDSTRPMISSSRVGLGPAPTRFTAGFSGR